MKKNKFSVRKHYRKNLTVVTVSIAVFSALMVIVITALSCKSMNKQISSTEQQTLSQLNYSLKSSLTQITTVASGFALVDMNFMNEKTDLASDKNFAVLKSQMSLCLTMFGYLGGIMIDDGTNSVNIGSVPSGTELSDSEKFKVIYKKDYLSVLHSKEMPNKLIVMSDGQLNQYVNNTVVILVEAYQLGQISLDEYNSKRMQFFTDSDGNVIISNRSEYIGKNIYSIVGVSDEKADVRSGFNEYKTKKQTLYTSETGIMGFSSVILCDNTVYSSYYNAIYLQSIGIGLVVIIVSLILSYAISRITYRPIGTILNTLGDFYPITPIENINELKFIYDTISELKQNSSEVNSAIVALKQQQVLALQAQLSPHFLFNTLDAINWISVRELGIPNDISTCIQKTSYILKSSMDINMSFSTIENEVKICQNCADVLKIRYAIELEVIISVPDDLLQSKILKNCLQPLVENCMEHGLANTNSNHCLKITAEHIEDNVKITVSDNGNGMDKEKLDELRKYINNFSTYDSHHIGMRNVNHRLNLLYGDKYGLTVSSDIGKGTSCTLLMPYQSF